MFFTIKKFSLNFRKNVVSLVCGLNFFIKIRKKDRFLIKKFFQKKKKNFLFCYYAIVKKLVRPIKIEIFNKIKRHFKYLLAWVR